MSHQDTDRLTQPAPHHQALKAAIDWLLGETPAPALTFRHDCTWSFRGLIFAAILWAWSDEKTLTDRFFLARKVVIAMAILTRPPAASYQAFLKMLRTWTATLTTALVAAFRRHMETDLADRFTVHRFEVFGVDGSRLELPRTLSNEKRFSANPRREKKPKSHRRGHHKASRARRSREKKSTSPQMWLTTMFHIGTGLPWDWRIGPTGSSERGHLQEMIEALPAKALVTADAGFVGYETWKALLDSGRHLLVRVGANVQLLKGLGYVEEHDGQVYLWPDREIARRRPPLVLRLVVAQGGRHPVYLVTSVLDARRLRDEQVVELYSLRWGVELFYRHFKQTFERRKLRSHTADHAEVEATWSLLGLWAMGLHGEVELAREGVAARRISVAKVLSSYRRSLREYASFADPGESLRQRLSRAIIDPYKRANKASRDYPRKKRPRTIGAPEICLARDDQINAARGMRDQPPLGLTA